MWTMFIYQLSSIDDLHRNELIYRHRFAPSIAVVHFLLNSTEELKSIGIKQTLVQTQEENDFFLIRELLQT